MWMFVASMNWLENQSKFALKFLQSKDKKLAFVLKKTFLKFDLFWGNCWVEAENQELIHFQRFSTLRNQLHPVIWQPVPIPVPIRFLTNNCKAKLIQNLKC